MCCFGRHGHIHHEDGAETYPADDNRMCKCLGLNNATGEWLGDAESPVAVHGQCCGAVTGDDGYCDRCRNTCVPKMDVVSPYPPEMLARGILPGGVIPKGHDAQAGLDLQYEQERTARMGE